MYEVLGGGPRFRKSCLGFPGCTKTAAVMADWEPHAAGAAEREALHKSIVYPQGRGREVAELEQLFDDKLGPHVR